MTPSEPRIERFNFVERAVHWLVALSFLYAALTGLSLWSPRLYWLAAVFGGGSTVSRWHPWGGLIFVVVFALMFRAWRRQMYLDADDRRWLRQAHRYAAHQEAGLPEAGRFNAGQKVLFWLETSSGLVLLLTGLVLWWPEAMPRVLRLGAILIHSLAALAAIGAVIVHIYMGTAAVPESFRGMIHGWVHPRWALFHHPKWYRDVQRR